MHRIVQHLILCLGSKFKPSILLVTKIESLDISLSEIDTSNISLNEVNFYVQKKDWVHNVLTVSPRHRL